ncbi:MAG: hypothetical protein ACXVDB_08225 [Tumebacillaceae bacterium]
MKNLLLLPLELLRILIVLTFFGVILYNLVFLPLENLLLIVRDNQAIHTVYGISTVLITITLTIIWYRRRGQYNGWVRLGNDKKSRYP